jgi:Sel1 repeat
MRWRLGTRNWTQAPGNVIDQVTLTRSLCLGVTCPVVTEHMKPPVLLSLLIIPLFAPFTVAVPQTLHSEQAVSASTYQSPKSTETYNARAQFWLGAVYEQGLFGKTDFQEALKWWRKAARQGDSSAQNALGEMYEDGEGVPQNYVLAAQWYRKAAEHVPDFGGACQGRNNLGCSEAS